MYESNYTPARDGGAKYQLLMELGKGGMGIAHLAISRGPQGFTKLLVLKIMRRELVGDDDLRRMFLEEARLSARLAHPNIVHVYEVDDHEGCPCIVMEYLDGQPLSSLLTRAKETIPLPIHLQIISRVLAGLHAAHELTDYDGTPLKLVHRDVSPHNIFVLFDGQVKLLDFGIAKAVGSEVETRIGSAKGKLRYMSPEQLLCDPLDRRADVFAVGVLLWEALAGRRLWADMDEGEITRSLVNQKIPPLPTDRDIAPALRAICERALAPAPEARYPSAEAFQRDVEGYLSQHPAPAGPEEVGAFLSAQFGGLREATKKLVDHHVKSVQSSGTTPVRTPTSPRLMAAPRPDADGVPGESETLVCPPPSTDALNDVPRAPILAPILEPMASRTGAVARGAAPAPTGEPGLEPPRRSGLRDRIVLAARWHRLLVAGAIIGVLGFVLAGVSLLRLGSTHAETRKGVASAGPAAAPPVTCAAGFKLCGDECVSIDRPDFGCGGESCQSCPVLNATARCNQRHECDSAVCYQAFDDCDGNSRNGCETDLRVDPDHCGACDRRCPVLSHAERGCGDTCTIWRCERGFGDCNGKVEDGCEVNTQSDPSHCGRCGVVCGLSQRCRHGECGR